MNANARTDLCLANRSGNAEPLYFQSGDNRLFGWLHRPARDVEPELGVVICSPFGYESICAHRSVREFAESISAEGIPALRFDYLGTGDSADIDENADHVELWSQDVLAAIGELRHQTGVERVCLLGIRLGALLAALAAAKCRTVDSLIFVGPIISGRRYVRELRTTQLAGVALTASKSDGDPESNQTNLKFLEAGGFSLSTATLQTLSLVDLQTAAAPAVRSILILDNDRLPSAKRWAESLSNTAIELEYKSLPGLIEMAMTAPQFATVPREMIDTTRQWLTRKAAQTEAHPQAGRRPPDEWATDDESSIATTLPLLAEDSESPLGPIMERPVFISTGATLFGIISEPCFDEKRRRAVILLNAGADHHVGASRMYVSLARRWARRGYFVLRLDFAGIGDSATRPGNPDDEVFPDEAIDDIRSAIEFMRSRYAIVDMTLAGLCSGAYHALRAAIAGLSVNRILMVNPQNYFWKKGMTLEQVQMVEVAHNPALYRRRLLSSQAWLRIFRGQVNIWRIGVIYVQRVRLACEAALRSFARLVRIRLPNDLAWELQKIVDNGIRVTFVFAPGERGLDLLKLEAGSKLSRLGDRCRVRLVESGDHIFSRRESRFVMEDILSEELFARAADADSIAEARASRALREASAK